MVPVEHKEPRASRHAIEGEERHDRPVVVGSHCNSGAVDHREERVAVTGASRRLPRALGPQRSGDLSQDTVPGGLSRRRLHRIPRVVELSADPQRGYYVVFQPLADGKASGPFMVFAGGFAGAYKDPGRAAFRPTWLAEGPDGALYVSDDVHGRIWRITYNGDGSDKVAPAPAPAVATTAPALAMPPEGTHPDAGRSTPHCRALPATQRIRWRSATVSSMARRATAPAADVTGRTPAAARSGPRLIQAIGCGATAAFRGSLRRSRAASRIPGNIRASCRHWAALRFRRRT